ncbi:hypothetical protein L2E82_17206 [Cichorium intybus]|uniref:Uncharacterized protein n=1 Tax=Cichorium intybus TaxID=13427 RepID=A0ACB9F8B3_CICIN|nr:hypothetical protein L2E82_17206 [Cichorium intybus]
MQLLNKHHNSSKPPISILDLLLYPTLIRIIRNLELCPHVTTTGLVYIQLFTKFGLKMWDEKSITVGMTNTMDRIASKTSKKMTKTMDLKKRNKIRRRLTLVVGCNQKGDRGVSSFPLTFSGGTKIVIYSYFNVIRILYCGESSYFLLVHIQILSPF